MSGVWEACRSVSKVAVAKPVQPRLPAMAPSGPNWQARAQARSAADRRSGRSGRADSCRDRGASRSQTKRRAAISRGGTFPLVPISLCQRTLPGPHTDRNPRIRVLRSGRCTASTTSSPGADFRRTGSTTQGQLAGARGKTRYRPVTGIHNCPVWALPSQAPAHVALPYCYASVDNAPAETSCALRI